MLLVHNRNNSAISVLGPDWLVNRDNMDLLDLVGIANDFVRANQYRLSIFGQFV